MADLNKKTNRHILVQNGAVFLVVIVIMTLAVAVFTYVNLWMGAIDIECENAYYKAFNAAEELESYDAYPFYIQYWDKHPEVARRMTDDETADLILDLKSAMDRNSIEFVAFTLDDNLSKMSENDQRVFCEFIYQLMLDKFEDVNKTKKESSHAPILLGVRDDGEMVVLIDDPNDTLNVFDVLSLNFNDIHLVTAESTNTIPWTENLVYISVEDGSDFTAAAYPVIADNKTYAVVLVGIETGIMSVISDNIRSKYAVITVIMALFAGIILLLTQYQSLVKPLSQLRVYVSNYTDELHTDRLVERLQSIKVRNEIGGLAKDIEIMAKRIKEYAEEKTKLVTEKAKLDSEMSLAADIQKSMLSTDFPDDREKRFRIYATMDPAKDVGGDLYDFFFIDDDHLALVIADVSGKGIPAALFMMETMTLIKEKAVPGKSPAQIVDEVNNSLMLYNKKQLFVTTWFMVIELSTGRAVEVNAGHDKPVLCQSGGSFTIIKNEHSMALGIMNDIEAEENYWELKPGDKIFLYTDGVTDAINSDKKFFGEERMLEALNEVKEGTPKEILEHIKNKVTEFEGDAPVFDDIAMLALEYKGSI
jgi:serine phosphatase RsbU (regulator of sigma subunit)